MGHAGERVAPLCAQLVGNIFVAAGERDRLESDRLNFVDVLRGELYDLTNGVVIDAVDDRDDQRHLDADLRQVFNCADLHDEQVADAAMFVLLFADTVELQIDAVLTGCFCSFTELDVFSEADSVSRGENAIETDL